MRNFFRLITFTIFICLVSSTYGAEIPRVNLDEAERYFNNAYVHFMRRDYREAQMYLDHAIKENTYMVDYYLLSALNLDRIGDVEGSMSAIKSYLEVRPMDNSAPRIAQYFDEQYRVLRTLLGTAPVPVSWRYAETTVQTEWNTGYTRPFSIKGLGKVRTLGEIVSIPDTFGDQLFIRHGPRNLTLGAFSLPVGPFREINVPSPVIAIPLGDGTFTIFNSEGEVYSFRDLDIDSNKNTASKDEAQYIATLPSLVVAAVASTALIVHSWNT